MYMHLSMNMSINMYKYNYMVFVLHLATDIRHKVPIDCRLIAYRLPDIEALVRARLPP